MVSWDHIFASLNQYFSSLRQELHSDQHGARLTSTRGITEQELAGLLAVCRLVGRVADRSAEARCALAESQTWLPTIVLFGLAGCGVPVELKAEILSALGSLALSPELAASLWQTLELSQVRGDSPFLVIPYPYICFNKPSPRCFRSVNAALS